MAMWELRQPENSDWHYVGQTFAAPGTHTASFTLEQPQKEGINNWEFGGRWKRKVRSETVVTVRKIKKRFYMNFIFWILFFS